MGESASTLSFTPKGSKASIVTTMTAMTTTTTTTTRKHCLTTEVYIGRCHEFRKLAQGHTDVRDRNLQTVGITVGRIVRGKNDDLTFQSIL
ncbi:hypothetical protein V1478_015151 [Vespula squamosa]|uniref:Uncharacterized protein n=1 Tax=Vespula squamosa TaxID=30214 RepID=A0ABD2A499_VESSQ